jgi:hypothetical protein
MVPYIEAKKINLHFFGEFFGIFSKKREFFSQNTFQYMKKKLPQNNHCFQVEELEWSIVSP